MTIEEIKKIGEAQLRERGVPAPSYRCTFKMNGSVWSRGRRLDTVRINGTGSSLQSLIASVFRTYLTKGRADVDLIVEVSEYGNKEWRVIPQDTIDFLLNGAVK